MYSETASASTLADLYRQAVRRLTACGVDSPKLDARLVIEYVLSLPVGGVVANPQARLTPAARESVAFALVRRCGREPVSRIIGYRGFWKLDFTLGPGVFDPRPDSEVLVETALRIAHGQDALRVLDLGCGSGCLLLSIVQELSSSCGVGVDISDEALAIAILNAQRHRLNHRVVFHCSDWCQELRESFDLIVCNPPYIRDDELAQLPLEVGDFDPRIALAGGADGLESYRTLASQLGAHLAPGGSVLFEVGCDQATAVASLLKQRGFRIREILTDLAGHKRCVVADR